MPHRHIIFPLFSCYIYIYDYIICLFPLFAAHFSCFFFSVLCFERQSPGFAGCCPCSSGACDASTCTSRSRTGTTRWIMVDPCCIARSTHSQEVSQESQHVPNRSQNATICYHMLPCFIMFLVQKCVPDFVITSHLPFSHSTWERPCKCRILVSAPGPGATASSGATTKSRTRSYEKVQHMQHTATVRFHMFILVILFLIISEFLNIRKSPKFIKS